VPQHPRPELSENSPHHLQKPKLFKLDNARTGESRMKKPKQPDQRETEMMEEIGRMERPKGLAGTGSSKMAPNRNVFLKGVLIGTGINEDPAEVNRIVKATVHANFEAMKQSCFLIGETPNSTTLT